MTKEQTIYAYPIPVLLKGQLHLQLDRLNLVQ